MDCFTSASKLHGLTRQPSLKKEVVYYDFHFALFLVAVFERLVRGFSTLLPELPLHSKTLNAYSNLQRSAHSTSAEAAAHPKIAPLIRPGNSKSKVLVNAFLKELVLYPG